MLRRDVLGCLVGAVVAGVAPAALAQGKGMGTGQRMGTGQGMGSGQGQGMGTGPDDQVYGSQMMTEQERTEYHARMRSAATEQEREQIRAEHHARMVERARERGIKLPDVPPAGRGMGTGRGG